VRSASTAGPLPAPPAPDAPGAPGAPGALAAQVDESLKRLAENGLLVG